MNNVNGFLFLTSANETTAEPEPDPMLSSEAGVQKNLFLSPQLNFSGSSLTDSSEFIQIKRKEEVFADARACDNGRHYGPWCLPSLWPVASVDATACGNGQRYCPCRLLTLQPVALADDRVFAVGRRYGPCRLVTLGPVVFADPMACGVDRRYGPFR